MASIRLRLGLTQPRTVGVVQRLRQVSKLKPSRFSPFYTSLSIIAYRLSTGTDRQDQLRESLTVFFSYFHTVSSSPLEVSFAALCLVNYKSWQDTVLQPERNFSIFRLASIDL